MVRFYWDAHTLPHFSDSPIVLVLSPSASYTRYDLHLYSFFSFSNWHGHDILKFFSNHFSCYLPPLIKIAALKSYLETVVLEYHCFLPFFIRHVLRKAVQTHSRCCIASFSSLVILIISPRSHWALGCQFCCNFEVS